MAISFTTSGERSASQLRNLPKPKQVKIRRKKGARGFFHQNKVVAEGQTIKVDPGTAAMLVQIGKCDYVTDG